MKRVALPASFLLLLVLGSAFSAPLDDHPSLVSRVFATYMPAVAVDPAHAHPAEAMAQAARAFLGALEGEPRAACGLALDDPERRAWTNVPPGPRDGGARLGDLDERQLELLCDLLAQVLSPEGYRKVRDILLADDRLLAGGRPRQGFGAEEFRIVLFGELSATEPWALQLDGHHLGLNLTFHGERVTMSPSFFGTQPAVYVRDGAEVAPLRGEVDDAFELINALDEAQREEAILGERRGQIQSGPGRDGVVPDPTGFSCAGLDDAQRPILRRLLSRFLGTLPEASARRHMDALEPEIDRMVFAWNGPTENPSDVSWRIQGPSLVIEYACQDLGGKPLDHLHSIYRDPLHEYGAGL